MSPEDVHAEWVEKVAAEIRARTNVLDDPDRGTQCEEAVEVSHLIARGALAAVLPDVAQGVRDLGHAMREADGWDEEWSTREVRDALNIAANRIDRKEWS